MIKMKALGKGFATAVMLLLMFLSGTAMADQPSVCLAGVHWYSNDEGMIDMSLPYGKRGWNVECIYDVNDPSTATGHAITAKQDGLVNIIRICYKRGETVPKNSANYASWASGFRSCIQAIGGNADYYIVGNEPPMVEAGSITDAQYVAAFNYLWNYLAAERSAGKKLLIAGPNAFGPISLPWLNYVAAHVTDASGIAIHSYGDPNECPDPRVSCNAHPEWPFDSGFQYFRDQLDELGSRWDNKPILMTEINTDRNGLGIYPDPIDNYQDNWINKAMQAVRDYNSSSYPKIWAVCWFVDRADAPWGPFALRNIPVARQDMTDAFHNPQNMPGSGQSLEELLISEGEAHQVIQFNPNAALQKKIFEHGFVPNSGEFNVYHSGITYVAQRAEHLGTGQVRVYYCKHGEWHIVNYVVRP